MSACHVLGGGIAGLSAAYYLSKISCNTVTILEASNRLGGWIYTTRKGNGTLYESGPRTLRLVGNAGLNILQLIEELGLEEKVRPVLKSSSAAKNRMIFVDGKLHPMPNSLLSLFKTSPPFSKPLFVSLLKDLTAASVSVQDESIHSFVSRRFGIEVADYAVSSLVCGVCAGDAKQISVNLLLGPLFEWEQRYGGVFKGMLKSAFDKGANKAVDSVERCKLAERAQREGWSVWSLKDGLETLPRTLSQCLSQKKSVSIDLNAQCQRIQFLESQVILGVNGKEISCEHVFCGLPSAALSRILPKEHHVLQEELAAIPTVTVGVVNLEYDGDILPIDGFGFLVPPNQDLPILGVIFDTCCFPQGNKTVLTVMMGGAWFPQLFGSSPDPQQLIDIAVNQIEKTLLITRKPDNSQVSILKDCIPQYVVGHKARVQRIRNYIKHHKLPLTLIGSSYDGIGVNDVILSSRKAVESFCRRS